MLIAERKTVIPGCSVLQRRRKQREEKPLSLVDESERSSLGCLCHARNAFVLASVARPPSVNC